MIQITYQKRNGELFNRLRNTYVSYRVGDTTSMGWKVLDIKYKYGNKYYSPVEYDRIIDKKWKRAKKNLELKHKLKTIYDNLNHITLFLLLFRILIIISNKTF
jgi:hypothetical protein